MGKGTPYLPVLSLFTTLTIAALLFRPQLARLGFDVNLLIGGNLLLLAITLISMYLLTSGLKASSTNAFLRSVYGGFMIKFFIVAAAVFGYAFLTDGKINKPSVFTLMGLYLVYTFIETSSLLKLTTKKTDHG
jgi:hypothetical protein